MTRADALNMALTSLEFYEQRVQDYEGYPSEDFRRSQLRSIEEAKAVLRNLRSGRDR